MLRRLKVRARLMTVIAVPLVLLLVVAVPQVLQRLDRASTADRAAGLTRAVSDVTAAVDALQSERTLSAARRASSSSDVAGPLAAQRDDTDAAIEGARAALGDIAGLSGALTDAVTAAGQALDRLDDVRAETDVASSIVPWVDPFAPVIDSLIAVEEDLGSVVADARVGGELTQVALLARAKDAATAQDAQMAAAMAWGELRGAQADILTTLRGDELAYRTAYLAAVPSVDRVTRRSEVQQGAVTSASRMVDDVVADGDVTAVGGLDRWLEVGAARQSALGQVQAARTAEGLHRATELGAASRRASTAYAGLAGAGLLLALALALFAARSITRPLRRLTDAADDLAGERLPRLVNALRNPGDHDERYLAATLEPIEVRSDDELAHLGRAFNAVQSVAVDVAAQQAELLRKGITDLYVNLARRNQSLIERQIELLDRLEADEGDPEVLENLFLLDHLATRMRRNAESLLVLASADTAPRRARAIPFTDVVRAALSEVEDYDRVVLGTLAEGTLQGPVVSDVAHLLAELLENSISFSSPETKVRIDSLRAGSTYQLVITDHGVGMPPEQLEELNAVLRDPPVTGLALGRSLGCLVAARLAARHDIDVKLRAGQPDGIVAFVVVPVRLLEEDAMDASGPAVAHRTLRALDEQVPITPMLPVVPQVALGGAPEHGPIPVAAALEPAPADPGMDAQGPASLREALPARAAFEAGLQGLLAHDRPDRVAEPDTAEHDDRQALARRVPGASSGDFAPRPSGDGGRRSPDEVRAMLSKYRSGLHAGRASTGSASEREDES
jgi:signal transduction histidine kinase